MWSLNGGMNQTSKVNQTSKDKPKWWECGGQVRGKKRESDAAGERGASGQDVTEERRASSFVLSGHRPGLMSDLGGVAGWRTKEAARVAQAEAPPVQEKKAIFCYCVSGPGNESAWVGVLGRARVKHASGMSVTSPRQKRNNQRS